MRISTFLPLFAAIPHILAVPQAVPFTNTTALPVHYGLVVFPGFQALDVFGPLDILNNVALFYNTSMHISILSSSLDPVSTVPLKNPFMNMTHSDFGEAIKPTHTFKEVLAAGGKCPSNAAGHGQGGHPYQRRHDDYGAVNITDDKGPIDVLIVPGGSGTRAELTEEIAFVKEMYPKV
jgi:hypothetical protein